MMGLKDLFVKRKGEASVGLTTRALKQWADDLPLLDLPRSAVLLDSMMFKLIMSEHRDKSWYELLEVLFEPIGAISRLAYEKFNGDISSSKESRRALLYFIRQLHLRLADNCFHMIIEGSDSLSKQQKYRAAFYAMQSYSLVILRSYQLSMMLPKGVWTNFYNSYRSILDISNNDFHFVLNTEVVYKSSSPLSLFSSAIIISILSPYKLSPEILENIYLILNETVDNSIFNQNKLGQDGYCFSANLDRAPSKYQFYPKNEKGLIFIDTKLILDKLNKRIVAGFKINQELIDGLKSVGTRQEERFISIGKAKIISGVSNSYSFLYGNTDSHSINIADGPEIFSYVDKESKSWPLLINVYKKSLLTSGAENCRDNRLMRWEIIDHSHNGVGLISCESYPVAELAVGNFVQFYVASNDNWVSGIVRWMNIKEDGLISLGLEFLAKKNEPVYLQNKQQELQGYKSIAILGKYTFKPCPNLILITQGLSYKEGDSLDLIFEQHNISIELTSCLEATKNCRVFGFKALEEIIE